MAAGYKLVGWNRFKRGYDALLLTGVVLFLTAHLGAGFLLAPAGQHPSEIQLLIRASGAAAFSLLTIILCLGPLARMTPRALRDQGLTALRGYLRALAAADGALPVLLVEDLHWADDSSLDLLQHLQDHAAELPLALVMTGRPSLLQRRADWGTLEARVHLHPLPAQAGISSFFDNLLEIQNALNNLVQGKGGDAAIDLTDQHALQQAQGGHEKGAEPEGQDDEPEDTDGDRADTANFSGFFLNDIDGTIGSETDIARTGNGYFGFVRLEPVQRGHA